jgi:nucleoside phosphorylase
MACGDLVLDLQGSPAELPGEARGIAAEKSVPIHFGRIAQAQAVLSPAEKEARGRSERAAAVDMESAALRACAEKRGIPFIAVRVVLDGLADSLPTGLPEGEDFSSLWRYALSHWAELPLLLRTGLRQQRAMAALARFIPPFLEVL